jgi:TetR/AcrR family transcriptional regulator, transcriptional repressor of bet genes
MRPSNTQQRRAQIVEALVEVMARKGYDGASIADVATQAGLAPGLVHYHFKSKLEILLAVLQELMQKHDCKLDQRILKAGDDPLRQLEAFIDFHIKKSSDAPPNTLACWIMLSGEALRQPMIRESFEQNITSCVDRLRSIIEQGVSKGVFNCKPAVAASAIEAAIQGYFVLSATAPALVPKGTAAGSVKKMSIGITGAVISPKRRKS